ncbi:hypothetical protein CC86DRAFT_74588 [Ophiobolus disseminans]|uniref:Uncharacterized protein n=1 Tax=Ophiobolus disseminans TaxID=1469910 RepID=A0A6A6ZRC1_9PLEO|nr:hypothetical protein CC86DRAFT_74588 [Ophiobolus disseminans]
MTHNQHTHSHHCQGSQSFMRLPPELRDMVYGFVMAGSPSHVSISSHIPISNLVFLKNTLPGVCFANKVLHGEAVLIFLRCTRLVFADAYPLNVAVAIQSLEVFLAQFGNSCESIRMLTFYEMRRFGSPDEIYAANFASRCLGLQHLVVVSGLIYLTQLVLNGGDMEGDLTVRLLSKAEILARWGLDDLFALTKLESVKFHCTVPR